MKAAGRTLVVSELLSDMEQVDGSSMLEVVHPSGNWSAITEAEVVGTRIRLSIDADSDYDSFRDLLDKTVALINDPPKTAKDLRQALNALADEIEEAL